MPKNRRRISWRLKDLLEKENVTPTDLARDLGAEGIKISERWMRFIVSDGAVKPNSNVVLGIVKYFDCELSDVLRTERRKTPAAAFKKHNRKYQLVWKLKQRYEESGLSYRDISEKLADIDVQMSRPSLCKAVNRMIPPKKLDIKYLEGLITIFSCDLEDILDIE